MAELKGTIFNIQRYSTEDGPGIRTTVFLKGCAMRCPWCQNPESINKRPQLIWHEAQCIGDESCIQQCPRNALAHCPKGIVIDRQLCDTCGICTDACPTNAMEILGKTYTVTQVASIVLEDKTFYEKSNGGMTLSGGEPAMQPAFCTSLMKAVKREGIHVALDTCCGVSWEKLSPLADLADLLLIDLKIMDEAKHLELTGVPLDLVLANAMKVSQKGKPIWVRTPIIPGYTESVENIRKTAGFIKRNLPTAVRYDILAFNNYCASKYSNLDMAWALDGAELIPAETMETLAETAMGEGLAFARWSGLTRA